MTREPAFCPPLRLPALRERTRARALNDLERILGLAEAQSALRLRILMRRAVQILK